MSGFSSLNVGAQALFAAQRALDVTGQNVSNANTEGYSRQRVQQRGRGASVVPALFTRSDGTPGGVDVLGTQRIRDGFLESRAHQEHAAYVPLRAPSPAYVACLDVAPLGGKRCRGDILLIVSSRCCRAPGGAPGGGRGLRPTGTVVRVYWVVA